MVARNSQTVSCVAGMVDNKPCSFQGANICKWLPSLQISDNIRSHFSCSMMVPALGLLLKNLHNLLNFVEKILVSIEINYL